MHIEQYETEDLAGMGVDIENAERDPLPIYVEKLQAQFHKQRGPKFLWLRVVLFAVINAVALCILTTLCLHVPLFLGRYVFSWALMATPTLQNDIYALALGFAISIAVLAGLKHLAQVAINVWQVHVVNLRDGAGWKDLFTGRLNAVVLVCKQWGSSGFKLLVLVSTMGVIAPLLLGTIFREV